MRFLTVCQICCLIGILLCFSGCEKPDEITVTLLPKPAGAKLAVKKASDSDRMFVGLFVNEGSAWFFKVVGEKERVTNVGSKFRAFLMSVEFKDGKPEWKVPDGWEKIPNPSSMRFATFKLDEQEPPLQLSISSLGISGDFQEYLLLNVNRWRKEMALSNIGASELDQQLTKIEKKENAYFMELVGSFGGGAMGRAPFAGGGGPFSGGPFSGGKGSAKKASTPKAPPRKKLEDIQVVAPETWTKSAQTQFSRLAYKFVDGEQQISVTVSPLTKANVWSANATRWAGSVNAKIPNADELKEQTVIIDVNGIEGKWIQFTSPDKKTTMIGAMVLSDNFAWFYKLQGNGELVEKEKANFKAFVESSKFE